MDQGTRPAAATTTHDESPGRDGRPAVSVVLPTHDERPNLEVLIPGLLRAVGDEPVEIIVVDDASTDGSPRWLAAQAVADPRIRPVFGGELAGIGDALRRGYDTARGEIIVSLDADLSFEPEVVPALVAAVRAGSDLVIGSRHHPRGSYQAPSGSVARKRLVSAGANRLLRLLVPVGISDFSVDCRAIRRALWTRLTLHERTNIWLIEMVVAAAVARAALGEIPVTFRDRRFGTSKLRLGREVLLTGHRTLRMVGEYWLSRLAGPAGAHDA